MIMFLLEDDDLLLALPAFGVSVLLYERLYFVAAALAVGLAAWRFWIPQAQDPFTSTSSSPSSAAAAAWGLGDKKQQHNQHRSKDTKTLPTWDTFVLQFRNPAPDVRSSERCISCWTDDDDRDYRETAGTFLANTRLRLPRCGHTLCLGCSRTWFTIHQQTVCPLCQTRVLRSRREASSADAHAALENTAAVCQLVSAVFAPLALAASLVAGSWVMAGVEAAGMAAALAALAPSRRLMRAYGAEWWRQSPAAKAAGGPWSNLGYWVLQAAWTVMRVQWAYGAWVAVGGVGELARQSAAASLVPLSPAAS